MDIQLYEGDREALRPLFRLADDSEQQIDEYLNLGEVLVADDDGEAVAHLQLVADPGRVFELKSMAVIESRRGEGIGRLLVHAAIRYCQQHAAVRLLVATAAADVGNLRFYQLQGFRMLRIERDAFDAAAGYADGIVIDGIPLRDRVWLDQEPAEQEQMVLPAGRVPTAASEREPLQS
jgi:GNAT superfamily N-acetyltransferase